MKQLLDSVDAVLGSKPRLSMLLLRLGLAAVFLYAAVSSIVTPEDWVSYLPHILRDHVSPTLLLKFFSMYELLLAAWLLSGVYVRFAGLACAATLAGILVSNLNLLQITFRDLGLLFAALAIAVSKSE